MTYPDFLKKGDTIGVCAPSYGVVKEPYISRFNNAIKTFEKLGFKVILSSHTRTQKNFVTCSAKTRAKEFEDLWLNDNVKMIWFIAGGELACEMLPYINFIKLKKSAPKWIQGFSDCTNLVFTICAKLDIATIYGDCFPEFGMAKWERNHIENWDFLTGKLNHEITSYDFYQGKDSDKKKEEGMALCPYNLDTPTKWYTLFGEKNLEVSGRILGGCLDIILILLGTPFDCLKKFNKKYQKDGIILFFESCDLTVFSNLRAMWQLKNAGYFKYVKAIVIGKPLINEPAENGENNLITFKDAMYSQLSDLNIPVIMDFDTGHLSPMTFIVNGSIATIKYTAKKSTISYLLK